MNRNRETYRLTFNDAPGSGLPAEDGGYEYWKDYESLEEAEVGQATLPGLSCTNIRLWLVSEEWTEIPLGSYPLTFDDEVRGTEATA